MKLLKTLSVSSVLAIALIFNSPALAEPLSCDGGTIEKINFSRTSPTPANAVRLALGEAKRLGGTPCTDGRSYVSEILALSTEVIRSDKAVSKYRYSANSSASLCCKAPTQTLSQSLAGVCPDGVLPQLKASCHNGSYGVGVIDRCEWGMGYEEDPGITLEANRQYRYCVPLPIRPDRLGPNPTVRADAIAYWDSPCATVNLTLRAPNGSRVTSHSNQPHMELVPYRPGLWVLEIKADANLGDERVSDECRRYQVYLGLQKSSPFLYLDGSDPAPIDWCAVWPTHPVCRP